MVDVTPDKTKKCLESKTSGSGDSTFMVSSMQSEKSKNVEKNSSRKPSNLPLTSVIMHPRPPGRHIGIDG